MHIDAHFFVDVHTSTIDKLLEQYEQDVEQIKYEFREERKRIIRDHDLSKTELQDIIYNMEKTFLDSETAAEQNFQANMEEQRNKVRRYSSGRDVIVEHSLYTSTVKTCNSTSWMLKVDRLLYKTK
jgi:hypothetical protein